MDYIILATICGAILGVIVCIAISLMIYLSSYNKKQIIKIDKEENAKFKLNEIREILISGNRCHEKLKEIEFIVLFNGDDKE